MIQLTVIARAILPEGHVRPGGDPLWVKTKERADELVRLNIARYPETGPEEVQVQQPAAQPQQQPKEQPIAGSALVQPQRAGPVEKKSVDAPENGPSTDSLSSTESGPETPSSASAEDQALQHRT